MTNHKSTALCCNLLALRRVTDTVAATVIALDVKYLTQQEAEYVRQTILAKHQLVPNAFLLTDCWKWTGCVVRSGYGSFPKRLAGTIVVHRLSYMAFRGEILATEPIVRHLCHNRSCCNPAHLEAGTAQDNTSDTFRDTQRSKREKKWVEAKPANVKAPYFWSEARFFKFVLGITWRHGQKLVRLGVLAPDGYVDIRPVFSSTPEAVRRHRSAMTRYHTPDPE